jgi:hypothetical protein
MLFWVERDRDAALDLWRSKTEATMDALSERGEAKAPSLGDWGAWGPVCCCCCPWLTAASMAGGPCPLLRERCSAAAISACASLRPPGWPAAAAASAGCVWDPALLSADKADPDMPGAAAAASWALDCTLNTAGGVQLCCLDHLPVGLLLPLVGAPTAATSAASTAAAVAAAAACPDCWVCTPSREAHGALPLAPGELGDLTPPEAEASLVGWGMPKSLSWAAQDTLALRLLPAL